MARWTWYCFTHGSTEPPRELPRPKPVEPEAVSPLNSDILYDATGLIDDLIDGLDINLDFSTGLERFIGPLTDLLGRLGELNRSNGASS